MTNYADHRTDNAVSDTTFEIHYTIGDLAARWRLGRETIRLLVKDEPGVLKVRMGLRKAMTRYSVPESVARRVHTKLFYRSDYESPRRLQFFGENSHSTNGPVG